MNILDATGNPGKSQPLTLTDVKAVSAREGQGWPMTEAVATSSSNSASDTLPDTE